MLYIRFGLNIAEIYILLKVTVGRISLQIVIFIKNNINCVKKLKESVKYRKNMPPTGLIAVNSEDCERCNEDYEEEYEFHASVCVWTR